MKQIAILPSGGHVREATGDTLFFNNERIFYASTLAIYILNAHTFSIEKILPCGTKTINCISVAPHDNNLVAASCVDGFLCVWNIDNEEMVSKIAVPMEVNIVWDPFCTSEFALISKEPNALKVFKWYVVERFQQQ
jgi:WD40 repeat protein